MIKEGSDFFTLKIGWSELTFQKSDILCVNEIGMPTNNIEKIKTTLNKKFGTNFFKGDKKRFETNGSPEGLFTAKLQNKENLVSYFIRSKARTF